MFKKSNLFDNVLTGHLKKWYYDSELQNRVLHKWR